jgi:hypothetical protein
VPIDGASWVFEIDQFCFAEKMHVEKLYKMVCGYASEISTGGLEKLTPP